MLRTPTTRIYILRITNNFRYLPIWIHVMFRCQRGDGAIWVSSVCYVPNQCMVIPIALSAYTSVKVYDLME